MSNAGGISNGDAAAEDEGTERHVVEGDSTEGGHGSASGGGPQGDGDANPYNLPPDLLKALKDAPEEERRTIEQKIETVAAGLVEQIGATHRFLKSCSLGCTDADGAVKLSYTADDPGGVPDVAKEILGEIVNRNQMLLTEGGFVDGLLFAHGKDDIVQLVKHVVIEDDAKRTVIRMKKLEGSMIRPLVLDRVCYIAPTKNSPLKHESMPDKFTTQIAHRLRSALPVLGGIVAHPIVRTDGSMRFEEGFDEATGLFVEGDWTRLDVPDEPTPQRVLDAVAKLREPYEEVAFKDDEQEQLDGVTGMTPIKTQGTEMTASEANAIGVTVSGLLRPMLPDVPFFANSSPQFGVGKGLAFDISARTVTGSKAHLIPLQDTIHMLNSAVTMAVRDFPEETFFKLDEPNSGRPFFSHLLASFATAGGKSGVRPPWARKATELDLHKIFAFCGVNFTVTRDWVRRICLIEFAPSADGTLGQARTFKKFKDKETLLHHVRDHRGEYIEAALVLIRNWHVKGRPTPDFAFDYADWVHWVGGTLLAAGITSWMANRNDMLEAAEGVAKGELLLQFYDLLTDADGIDPANFKSGDLAKLAMDAEAKATKPGDKVSASVSWTDDRGGVPWTAHLIAMLQGDGKRVVWLGKWFESVNGMILGNDQDLIIAVQGLNKRGNSRRWSIIVQKRPADGSGGSGGSPAKSQTTSPPKKPRRRRQTKAD